MRECGFACVLACTHSTLIQFAKKRRIQLLTSNAFQKRTGSWLKTVIVSGARLKSDPIEKRMNRRLRSNRRSESARRREIRIWNEKSVCVVVLCVWDRVLSIFYFFFRGNKTTQHHRTLSSLCNDFTILTFLSQNSEMELKLPFRDSFVNLCCFW